MGLDAHKIEIETLKLIDLFDSKCKQLSTEFNVDFGESLLETNDNLIISLKKKWDDFAVLLSQISFFKSEFQRMLSMKYMFEYIVEDNVLFKKYWKFIVDLSNLFLENLDYKMKLKESDSFVKDYEKGYKKFSRAFMKKEKFFYTTIYVRSEFYDESVLKKVINLLGSD